MLALGLPTWALNEEVVVEFHVMDVPNQTGRILEHTEHYIILEGQTRKYLIPWTAIAYLWVPKLVAKKKELSK